jgi:cytochrome P450
MRTVFLDLFTAGTETTSNSVSWFCLYLAAHPEIQAKLHDQIDTQIGPNRLPSLADREVMTYFEAATLELLRISSIISIGIFRSTLTEIEFHGYRIPKDTMVVMNLYACNHDEEYWGDPEVYRPERFLSPDGERIIKHEPFMAFGAGKRVCPGEQFALYEIFLVMTMILQRFTISPDPTNPNPSLEPIVSFVLSSQAQKLVFTPRD